jgi:hypothetical protein
MCNNSLDLCIAWVLAIFFTATSMYIYCIMKDLVISPISANRANYGEWRMGFGEICTSQKHL